MGTETTKTKSKTDYAALIVDRSEAKVNFICGKIMILFLFSLFFSQSMPNKNEKKVKKINCFFSFVCLHANSDKSNLIMTH